MKSPARKPAKKSPTRKKPAAKAKAKKSPARKTVPAATNAKAAGLYSAAAAHLPKTRRGNGGRT